MGFLEGSRILPDVNVLLLGLLTDESTSALLLAHCRRATLLLSDHIRDTARKVVGRKAPHLCGRYGDRILQLHTRHTVEHVASEAPDYLPPVVSSLGPEDCQVLVDALHGQADMLFSLDGDFLDSEFRGDLEVEIRDPGSLLWPHPLQQGQGLDLERESWTFLAWFIPDWDSALFDRETEGSTFYMLEVAGHLACYYEAHENRYVLEWDTEAGSRGRLELAQPVSRRAQHFVFLSVARDHVMLFVNGETRERSVRLGPIPRRTSAHPFSDADGRRQICGSVQFRFVPRALSEGRLRRHWKTSTLWLSDDEIQLQEILGPLLEYG